MSSLAIAILEALIASEVPEDVVRWLLAKLPEERKAAMLAAEYATARAATDVEAQAVLGNE